MKNKFLLSVIPAALCALLLMAACSKKQEETAAKPVEGNGTAAEQTQIADPDGGKIDYLADLSTERFDGYDFRILIRKGNLADQYLEEDSEDIVESAVYHRNKYVEDRYGVTISATESSDSNYETDALNTILAGDDAYDLVFTHGRAAFTYAVQGAALNIHDISSIRLDKPWWARDISNACTINGKLYVLSGDISSQPLGAAMCLLFNKRIFDELGFDYPYQMVRDGEWTFEEFAYLSKKGGKDLNGDGVLTPADDQFGFAAEEWESPMAILYCGGQKIYDKDDDGELYLSLYSNKTVEIYDRFFNLLNSESSLLQTSANHYVGGSVFPEGRAMFKDSEIRHAKTLRNMDDDFGILPYPKFDENDVYASASNGGTHLIIVPVTVSDPERTGAIAEALCAIGSRDVIPAFYEQSLKTKYSRDSESEEMLDIIKDSLVFDIGYLAGGTYQSCGKDLANAENHDFSSYYAARETKAKTAVEEFMENYGK